MKQSKIWAIFLIFVVFVFLLSFSIAMPIWCRFFYYMQIEPLKIPETSGYSREQIIAAYNEVMNFLNFGTPFGTGELNYSASGKSHFEDCKVLFDLDTYCFIASALILSLALVLAKTKRLTPYKFKGHSIMFFGAIAGLVVPIIVFALAATDFDRAFVVFHHIFFPGKDNWMFDPRVDQIITILPEDFFMNCGILAIAVLFSVSAVMIASDVTLKAKRAAAEKTSHSVDGK